MRGVNEQGYEKKKHEHIGSGTSGVEKHFSMVLSNGLAYMHAFAQML